MTQFESVGMKMMPYHIDCLEYLKKRSVAPIPRGVCQGRALKYLYKEGLIEKIGIRGFWAISDAGRSFDYRSYLASQPSRNVTPWSTFYIHPEPDRQDRDALIKALTDIDRIKPGGQLFGKIIKDADLEYLFGKSLSLKFVYFSYPLGYPLKHIGWALRHLNDKISDQYVTTIRCSYLNLPSRRKTHLPQDKRIFEDLLNEGLSRDEIREYFSAVERGEVL